MKARKCVRCDLRPQRAEDYFCSDACRTAHEKEHARERGRETVEMQADTGGAIYDGGRRLNLQNSA